MRLCELEVSKPELAYAGHEPVDLGCCRQTAFETIAPGFHTVRRHESGYCCQTAFVTLIQGLYEVARHEAGLYSDTEL